MFIDLNYTTSKQIKLCKISFDGYGCCDIDDAKHLAEQLLKDFANEIVRENLDQEKITKLVLQLVRPNKDKIWNEALEEYNLIDKK